MASETSLVCQFRCLHTCHLPIWSGCLWIPSLPDLECAELGSDYIWEAPTELGKDMMKVLKISHNDNTLPMLPEHPFVNIVSMSRPDLSGLLQLMQLNAALFSCRTTVEDHQNFIFISQVFILKVESNDFPDEMVQILF